VSLNIDSKNSKLKFEVIVAYRRIILIPISLNPVDLSGFRVVVLGGTNGIGLESAKILTQWNASVILTARSEHNGKAAVKYITSSLSEYCVGKVRYAIVELTSFKSVRKFAASFDGMAIKILINNAGMITLDSVATEDGIESMYQVNFLSHYLLTSLLIPALERGTPSRIVHTSSLMHWIGSINRERYSKEKKNRNNSMGVGVYNDVKLMQVVYSKTLNAKLSGVTSNSVHPGFVQSSLDRNLPPLIAEAALWVRSRVARTTEEGAATGIIVATDPELVGVGGLYFSDHCINSLCGYKQGGAYSRVLDAADSEWLLSTAQVLTDTAQDTAEFKIEGFQTMYSVIKSGDGDEVKPGSMVTVHATGIVQQTKTKFWSTRDAGQQVSYCLY